MKALKYFLFAGMFCWFVTGCNDDYLQKFPETSLNQETFFSNANDLETYTNRLYQDFISASWNDLFSDNISTYLGTSTLDNMIRGKVSDETIGGWTKDSWGTLRRVNFFLENGHKAQGNAEDINHFIGIAKYFRAMFYFNNLQTYGDLPWYSRPLKTTDTDLLYKSQDPRTLIADSIMADLDYAVKNVKVSSTRTRIHKYAALHLMARFSLYEGTFRKYHTYLNLQSTANTFLEKAVWAAEEIMNSREFNLVGSTAEDYGLLFRSGNLGNNKEMILYEDYDRPLNYLNNTSSALNWQWQLSRSLADSYLMLDGTPATNNVANKTKSYNEMFENRDPRMAQTIMPPGFVAYNTTVPFKANLSMGYLPQIKYYPTTSPENGGYGSNSTDLPLFRYAETLLIFAEAKAELGTITQGDLGNSVNLIRNRVGMPALSTAVALDPVLEAQYPNVTGSNKALLLEIRRERRVELACEGLRWHDLRRWEAGHLLEGPSEGIYISGFGPFDVTGDGVPDILLVKNEGDAPEGNTLNLFYLYDETGKESAIYLSEGDKGNIRFTVDKSTPRDFISPKYYYNPLPWTAIRDNPNLYQPHGWGN